MRKGDRGGEVIGLNPNIRVYRYTKGQFFDAHCKCDLSLAGTWGSPLPVIRIGTCLPAPPARRKTTTDLRLPFRPSRPITSSTELSLSLSTCLQLRIADDALCRLWCRPKPGISLHTHTHVHPSR